MEQAEALKAKGVQVLACLSVNDVFVTEEWGRAHKAEGKVRCGACEGSGSGRCPCFLITFCYLSYVWGGNSCHGAQVGVGG